jgi:hypothetical protein
VTEFKEILAFIIFRALGSHHYTLNINNMGSRVKYAPLEKDENEVERLVTDESRPSSSVSVRTQWNATEGLSINKT